MSCLKRLIWLRRKRRRMGEKIKLNYDINKEIVSHSKVCIVLSSHWRVLKISLLSRFTYSKSELKNALSSFAEIRGFQKDNNTNRTTQLAN